MTASALRSSDSIVLVIPGIVPSLSSSASVRNSRSGVVSTRLRIVGRPRIPPDASSSPHLRAFANSSRGSTRKTWSIASVLQSRTRSSTVSRKVPGWAARWTELMVPADTPVMIGILRSG